MIGFSDYEMDGQLPLEQAKALDKNLFFTPSDFKGFQSHAMYETLFPGFYPKHSAEYVVTECDSEKMFNKVVKLVCDHFGKTLIFRGSLRNLDSDGESNDRSQSTEVLLGWESQAMLNASWDQNNFCRFTLMMQDEESLETLHKAIAKKINKPLKFKKDRSDNFYMVIHNGRNLDLGEFKIDRKKYSTFDIEGSYNDDFQPVAKRIESFINSTEDTGIVLLHGVPGSGKTSFIRYLLSKITDKRIIYLPPDLATELSSPSFFNFIRKYDNSALVIEDAENILRKREGGGNQSIANLLNMSDGIMGDALKIQIICTFNAEFAEIDDALKRPGRLVASYHFDELSPEKTKAMVKKLYGDNVEPMKYRMTVAEIYEMKEERHVIEKTAPRKIGFL